MTPRRIAFITPEFVSENNAGGGLGNYLSKMTQALLKASHQPEVFVSSFAGPAVIDHAGVKVHRVHPRATKGLLSFSEKIPRKPGFGTFRQLGLTLSAASQLAQAFHARDAEAPFDAVQSSEFEAVGIKIRPRKGLCRIVRCSSLAEQYAQADARHKEFLGSLKIRYELKSLRHADIAYAPSQCAATYYEKRLGRTVLVCRPPALVEIPPSAEGVDGLPEKFLFHFGQLRSRKGIDWLASALPLAWAKCPDLKIVLAGQFAGQSFDQWQSPFGENKNNVTYLGALPKAKLYAVLRQARAAVLPSLVDNLPNTAIESLTLGIPVIGTNGASIDELVEQGVTGELVPMNDAAALADAMVKVWRNQSSARKGFTWNSDIARQMQPEVAVQAFLKLLQWP